MKLKKKFIFDHGGSSSQSRSKVRENLWGIVEKISRDSKVTVTEPAEGLPELTSIGLPVSFASGGNSAKRKRGRNNNEDVKSAAKNEGLIALPLPKYNGTLLEHHVYYVRNHPTLNGATVRIVGVASSTAEDTQMLVRLIDHDRIGSSATLSRRQLVEIPTAERADAHKKVQLDEQFINQLGMPDNIHLKYWDQRYRLLSRYDAGVKLDEESWYSITPEAVAKHVTASCIGRSRALGCKLDKVIDCFSGCGGNTIPFVALGKEVVSVDLDPVKLEYLRHNCGLYGASQAESSCVCADVYALLTALLPAETLATIQRAYQQSLLEEQGSGAEGTADAAVDKAHSEGDKAEAEAADVRKEDPQLATSSTTFPGADISSLTAANLQACAGADLIILSPPWGGPDYLNAAEYCLYTMLSSGCGLYLAMLAAAVCPSILYLLPVNTSVTQVQYIAEMVKMPYVIEYVVVNHRPKLMAIYMGAIASHRGGDAGTHEEVANYHVHANMQKQAVVLPVQRIQPGGKGNAKHARF